MGIGQLKSIGILAGGLYRDPIGKMPLSGNGCSIGMDPYREMAFLSGLLQQKSIGILPSYRELPFYRDYREIGSIGIPRRH